MENFDPKLKEAMAEIRGIMRKHDIGGYVILASPSHSEFGFELDPSWSCAHWEDKDAGLLRFKAKQKELGKDNAKKIIEETCHLVFQIRDLCAQGFAWAEKMAMAIETQVKVEHKSFSGFTPHREN